MCLVSCLIFLFQNKAFGSNVTDITFHQSTIFLNIQVNKNFSSSHSYRLGLVAREQYFMTKHALVINATIGAACTSGKTEETVEQGVNLPYPHTDEVIPCNSARTPHPKRSTRDLLLFACRLWSDSQDWIVAISCYQAATRRYWHCTSFSSGVTYFFDRQIFCESVNYAIGTEKRGGACQRHSDARCGASVVFLASHVAQAHISLDETTRSLQSACSRAHDIFC